MTAGRRLPRPDPRYTVAEIDHTGDAGYDVRARSLPDLFEGAAAALMGHLTILDGPCPRPRLRRRWRVHLKADDLATLLHDWLAEILYRSYVRGLVLGEARVERIDNGHLDALIMGEPFAQDRHERRPEVKAVTYHALEVRRRGAFWRARFVLDM